MTNDTITVVTLTQHCRQHNFLYLKEQLLNQTHKPTTWIIVNGSKTNDEAILLEEFLLEQNINTIVENYIYIPRTDRCFADMYNVAFEHCVTDYVALMEDDEYYQPTYLSHHIKMLANSTMDIAGCSKMYLWNSIEKQMYKWIRKGYPGHATNATLVFKKNYLKNHRYSDNNFSIEKSFLEDFEVPMIQIEAMESVIHIWHDTNTILWSTYFIAWKYNNCIETVSNKKIKKFTDVILKMDI